MIQEEIIQTKNKVILVVDDNKDNVDLIEEILSEQGYENILTASSGSQSLSIINKRKPDLVLLDIMMPEIDGFEVCSILKKNKETADIPVIMITAKNEAEDLRRGFEVGAVDYITKPFEENELVERVKSALKLKKLRDDVKSYHDLQLEEDLKKNQEYLEKLVEKHTVELERANEQLRRELKERKLTEDSLRKSEERYSAIVEGCNDGIIILKGVVPLFINQNAADLTGYSIEDLNEMNLMRFITPKHLPRALKRFNQLMTGENVSPTFELEMIRKDGHILPVEISSDWIDYLGEKALVVFVRDITERKQAEETIKAEQQKYKNVVENIEEGLFSLNNKGYLTYANPEASVKITGYTSEELIGMHVGKLLEIKTGPIALATLHQCLRGKSVHGLEVELYKKNGTLIPTEVSLTPKMENGDLIEIFGVIRDITERKRSEAKLKKTLEDLERSNNDLKEFAYIASHDLQEPLRMVSSYVQLLSRRYKGKLDSDADEFIDYAIDGAKRMQEMIQSLLKYSRVSTRGKPFKSTNCNSVLGVVLDNLEEATGVTDVEITHDSLPTVMADKMQFIQLFQNILDNAIKYRRKDNARIHVSAEKKDDEWVFSISDNGIGIDPSYKDQIFKIFWKFNENDDLGNGIGLAIAKKIVGRHGGRIWVESELGVGSTFYFTIPINEDFS